MTRTVLSLIFCGMLLTACAEAPRGVRVELVQIPEAMLTCPTEPKVPDSVATQRDVALYILDLRNYGQACESRLLAVKQLQDETSRP
jgi:hypothetical protein